MIFAGLSALAGVVLTLVILPPPIYGDTYHIWRAAKVWPSPADFVPLQHALRLGTILPTRLAQELLGDGHAALVAASALLAALLTAGTYAAGRALFGDVVGLLAVGLMVINPLFTVVDAYTREVANSTGNLLPDMPATGLFSGGVAALAFGSRRAGGAQTAWLASAGLCFGLAYMTREYVAFMFAAIPVFYLLLRIPQRRLVVPAMPMLAVVAVESVHNALVYGDPFARLNVAAEHQAVLAEPLTLVEVLLRFGEAVVTRGLGLIFLAALLLTIAGAVITRDRRLVLLLVWFFSLWLPLTILGGLLDLASPSLPTVQARYWFPVLPPLLIGGLGALGLLVRKYVPGSRRRVAAVLAPVALVAAVAYVGPAFGEIANVHRDEDWNELRGWLAQHPEIEVLHTDIRTSQTVPFYTKTPGGRTVWDGEFATFNQRAPELPAEVGDGPYLESNFGATTGPDVADGWRIIWQSSNAALVIWQRY